MTLGPISMFSCAYAVLTELAVAFSRLTWPKLSPPKLLTSQSSPLSAPWKTSGDRPSSVSSRVWSFSRAPMSVNGLKVEPAWTTSCVAVLSDCFT